MDYILPDIKYIDVDMGYPISFYSNRCIYRDTGCIYGCFLEMDFEAEEG